MRRREQKIDAAQARADIENPLAAETDAGDHLGDFLRSAWREEALAPHMNCNASVKSFAYCM